jgi:hypothetical protein
MAINEIGEQGLAHRVCLANHLDKGPSNSDLLAGDGRGNSPGRSWRNAVKAIYLAGSPHQVPLKGVRKLSRAFAPTTGTDAPAPGADLRNQAIVMASKSRSRDGGWERFQAHQYFFIR